MDWLRRYWARVQEALLGASPPDDALRDQARLAAPVVWLLGKTGAGKTAVVSALTGDARAEVGNGFQPCTREARFYDAPPEAPVLRFLDTRGLEEPGYDPAEDIAWCEGRSHLLLAVMQASDPAQEPVLRVVREARRRHPDWPVVVAQTGLHRLYASGQGHRDAPFPEGVEDALARQRALFDGLRGPAPVFVPLDFTEEGDGYEPLLFRLDALEGALAAALPEAAAALAAGRADAGHDSRSARARQSVWAYAGLSAVPGAMPVPAVGVAGLAALQAAMLRALATRFGVVWTADLFARFAGCLGLGTFGWFALRYGVVEAAKLVPGVGTLGAGAANAAFAAAFTAGTGEAALVFLRAARRGQAAPPEEVRRAYAEGFARWRASRRKAAA
ncbi:MAG: GTPase domain-containing protein [Acetobacteraceae bacterium]|nr:GTPase domain-containing protein [Acetobacteraceae bacterium]